MSTLLVEVCEVAAVEKHPYADRLGIATVKGWKTAVGFDPATGQYEFQPGERCIYFPPDSVLPPALANSPSGLPHVDYHNIALARWRMFR